MPPLVEGNAVTIVPAARTAVVGKDDITVPPLVEGDAVTIVPAARTAVVAKDDSTVPPLVENDAVTIVPAARTAVVANAVMRLIVRMRPAVGLADKCAQVRQQCRSTTLP